MGGTTLSEWLIPAGRCLKTLQTGDDAVITISNEGIDSSPQTLIVVEPVD